MKLYPFQNKSVEFHLTHHYSIDASEMGTGKTIVALETARRTGLNVVVFGPAFLRGTWEMEAEKFDIEVDYVPYSQVHKPRSYSQKSIFIADECFVAGTLIETPEGPLPIETLKAGDAVYSAAGLDEIVAIMQTNSEETIRVNNIECTLNHPFMTLRGWVPAGNLEIGDEILHLSEAMSLVRSPIRVGEEKSRAFLRDILLGEMENVTTGDKGQSSQPGDLSEDRDCFDGEEIPHKFRMAQKEQLYVSAGSEGESVVNASPYWPQAKTSRRQRSGRISNGEENEASPRGGLGARVCRFFTRRKACEAPLQNRSGEFETQNSDRDRRSESFVPEGSRKRQAEARRFRTIRVESLKIQERRSRTTYNLQVKKHPSYSVGGALVHNCHALKNPTTRQTAEFYDALKRTLPEYFLGLTGTPVKNRVPDFWTLIGFCGLNPKGTSGKKLEGDMAKYRRFARHFCNREIFQVRGRQLEKFTSIRDDRIPEFKSYLRDKYIRFRVEDVLQDLPSITRKEVNLKLQAAPDKALEEAFLSYIAGGKTDIQAKTQSAILKAPLTADYARTLLANDSGQLVIFSDHVEPARLISDGIPDSVLVSGKMSPDDRQEVVQEFQRGGYSAIVATIGSLSTGVTLHRSRHVIFNDLSWVPANNIQAEKRIHRIGQKDACVAHYIDATPTDAHIRKTLFEKIRSIEKVVE